MAKLTRGIRLSLDGSRALCYLLGREGDAGEEVLCERIRERGSVRGPSLTLRVSLLLGHRIRKETRSVSVGSYRTSTITTLRTHSQARRISVPRRGHQS